jgi:hypothetical protein
MIRASELWFPLVYGLRILDMGGWRLAVLAISAPASPF